MYRELIWTAHSSQAYQRFVSMCAFLRPALMAVTLVVLLPCSVIAADGWFEVTRGSAFADPDYDARMKLQDKRIYLTRQGSAQNQENQASRVEKNHLPLHENQRSVQAIVQSMPPVLPAAATAGQASMSRALHRNALSDANTNTAINSSKRRHLSDEELLAKWELQEFDPPAENEPGGNSMGKGRTSVNESGIVNSKDRSGIDASAVTDSDRDIQSLRNSLPATSIKTLNVNMFAGEVKVLGKVHVSRVAIGNGDIVRAEVLKSGELLVIANSAGSTSLRLWHADETQSDYNIRVSENDPETRVRMEPMVRMRVRMVEFRKSALGKLGIDWSDSMAGPGFAIAGDAVGNHLFRPVSEGFAEALPNTVRPFSTYFGLASNITSRINFLASTGDATTLAEPVLSTVSGGKASFLAGGEVPYPSIGSNGQTIVQFKEYGIKLDVSPSIDALGNVRTVIETEISQLDPAVSVQGAPGLLTRRAQTQVNVRSGETIVISGLLSSESSKDIDKLPGIGNLPIIGGLFRAQNARNAVSELVIFVTPEIIPPNDATLSDREKTFYQLSDAQIKAAHQQIPLLD